MTLGRFCVIFHFAVNRFNAVTYSLVRARPRCLGPGRTARPETTSSLTFNHFWNAAKKTKQNGSRKVGISDGPLHFSFRTRAHGSLGPVCTVAWEEFIWTDGRRSSSPGFQAQICQIVRKASKWDLALFYCDLTQTVSAWVVSSKPFLD